MEKMIEAITKWLRQFELKVYNTKTDLCLFYKHFTAPINIRVGEVTINSSKNINVLGVLFDSELNWS
jgi:hypothetical protein